MSISIKKHFKFSGTQAEIEQKRFALAVLADLTALRTAILTTNGSLDSNGGAGTGYVADNPAELTLVE